MLRKIIYSFFALACVFSLGGCFPGLYVASQPAEGMVVDAESGAPLPGVAVFYYDENFQTTDELGTFSFPKVTKTAFFFMGGEHPAWPHWGYHDLHFSKSGYVPLRGTLREVTRADGKVALEPDGVPKGLAALDERIAEARVAHRANGSVLVWLLIERSGDFGGFEETARDTLAVAKKVLHSELAGASPDLAFSIRRYGRGPYGHMDSLWSVQVGWTGEYIGRMDLLRIDEKEWLNGAAFAKFSKRFYLKDSKELEEAFAKFTADRGNARAYESFIEAAKSEEQIPGVFYAPMLWEWGVRRITLPAD